MTLLRPLLLLSLAVPMAAQANDFPTTDRVEYVLECMMQHPGKQEYLYKCSCTIDQIAQAVGYDEYVEIATALRHQGLRGQRGAEFRDPAGVKAMASKYKALQEQARKTCQVP
ncbi:hypothetical protein [Massilia sp. DWR3-1-1]|uniref:hypothetical protein n=1 Tax=Massilia sp. DWR3-1-1 TaxID=2804559 RepID=UPI003CE8DE3A